MPSDPKHVSGPGAAAQQRFLSVFLRSEREAFRYATALVPNVADAEDIVQQPALARWERFDAYDPAQPFTPSRVSDANIIGCQTTAGRWPGASATIPALASGKHEKACGVRLLGHDGALEFTQDQSGLRVQLPAERPGDHAFALEIIEPEWPKTYFANPPAQRGISGPGHALSPNAPLPVHRRPPVNSAVREGRLLLIPPLLNLHLRDTVICLGGDGNYYLTGSSGDDIWDFNDGVELWCSTDLQRWEYLGVVWTLAQDAIWEKDLRDLHGKPTVTIWVPEIRYLKQLTSIRLLLPQPQLVTTSK